MDEAAVEGTNDNSEDCSVTPGIAEETCESELDTRGSEVDSSVSLVERTGESKEVVMTLLEGSVPEDVERDRGSDADTERTADGDVEMAKD